VRVVTQASSNAEECKLVMRRKGAPVEFLDKFFAKIISPWPVNKFSAHVVEEEI